MSINNATGTTGTSSTSSTSTSGGLDGNAGNQELTGAFQEAIGSATETLAISTKGQATLNALRARPS